MNKQLINNTFWLIIFVLDISCIVSSPNPSLIRHSMLGNEKGEHARAPANKSQEAAIISLAATGCLQTEPGAVPQPFPRCLLHLWEILAEGRGSVGHGEVPGQGLASCSSRDVMKVGPSAASLTEDQ